MKTFIGIIVPLVFLSACAINEAPTIEKNLGEAVKHNIAVQTLNPNAGGEDDSTILDGQKAAQVIETYREPPEQVNDTRLIRDVGDN